jgi:hypothetical protein
MLLLSISPGYMHFGAAREMSFLKMYQKSFLSSSLLAIERLTMDPQRPNSHNTYIQILKAKLDGEAEDDT